MIPTLGSQWKMGVEKAVSAMALPTAHLSLTLGFCLDLSYRSPARKIGLTFQKANRGLRKPLHQPSHEELGAEELRRDKSSIFQEPNFIGRELHPF